MKSILIVEDDGYIRDILRMSLLRENYKVLEAQDGLEGLGIATRRQPDLIISDVMMPVMDGFELLENIKKDRKTLNIPFILLTAMETPAAKRLSEELGADAFVVKPFVLNELLYTIKNLLTRNQTVK
jgi:DNA-binding response OmpR family regulator